jgi:plasmid maintenance system killer protein
MEYQHLNDAIVKLYPQERKRISEGFYQELWKELRLIDLSENEDSMTIHVQYIKEHEKAEQYMWNVTYSMNRRLHHQYDLQFASKEQIVSAFVNDEDLEGLAAEEYIAHILVDVVREGQMEEQEDGIRSVEPKNHLPHFSDAIEYRSVDDVTRELKSDEFIE